MFPYFYFATCFSWFPALLVLLSHVLGSWADSAVPELLGIDFYFPKLSSWITVSAVCTELVNLYLCALCQVSLFGIPCSPFFLLLAWRWDFCFHTSFFCWTGTAGDWPVQDHLPRLCQTFSVTIRKLLHTKAQFELYLIIIFLQRDPHHFSWFGFLIPLIFLCFCLFPTALQPVLQCWDFIPAGFLPAGITICFVLVWASSRLLGEILEPLWPPRVPSCCCDPQEFCWKLSPSRSPLDVLTPRMALQCSLSVFVPLWLLLPAQPQHWQSTFCPCQWILALQPALGLGWALPGLTPCSSCFPCIPGDPFDPHFAIEIQSFVFPCVPLQKLQHCQHSSECVNTSPLPREAPNQGEESLEKFQVTLGVSAIWCHWEANSSKFSPLSHCSSPANLGHSFPFGSENLPAKRSWPRGPLWWFGNPWWFIQKERGFIWWFCEHLPRINSSLCFLNEIPVLAAHSLGPHWLWAWTENSQNGLGRDLKDDLIPTPSGAEMGEGKSKFLKLQGPHIQFVVLADFMALPASPESQDLLSGQSQAVLSKGSSVSPFHCSILVFCSIPLPAKLRLAGNQSPGRRGRRATLLSWDLGTLSPAGVSHIFQS